MGASKVVQKIAIAFGCIVFLHAVVLALLTTTWIQRHALYLHKLSLGWLPDYDSPGRHGFCKNQVSKFTIETSDGIILDAWHILPVGLYGRHEELLAKDSDIAVSVEEKLGFDLLTSDPEARLVINFHGNAGTIVQGWRPDLYRNLAAADSDKIHVLTFDYRGFGHSKGSPTEFGLITDAIAVVNWALNVAKIPPERIVLIGHSLGTAVTSAVAEYFVSQDPKVEFSGIVLVAPLCNMEAILSDHYVLFPLKPYTAIHSWFSKRFYDTWNSANRIEELARKSTRLRLTILHAEDDWTIRWKHSDRLFRAAVVGSNGPDFSASQVDSEKITIDLGKEGRLIKWTGEEGREIREYITFNGGHNRLTTYSLVPLAIRRSLDL